MARPTFLPPSLNTQNERNYMTRTMSSLALGALSLALIGATGCASLQPAPPPALPPLPAAAPAPAPDDVHASWEFGGLLVSIYHRDARTLYVWAGDPRPTAKRPMTCYKFQLSDTPSGNPKPEPCE
jgi:hypothetical protein